MRQFNLEEYIKNPNKRVVTRDGHDVRIVCTDCKNYEYPTVALVTCDDDEFVVNCTKEGKCHSSEKHRRLMKSSNAFHSFPASTCHYFLGGTTCHDHP